MARGAVAPAAPVYTRAQLELVYNEMIAVMQPDPPFPAISRKVTDQQIIDTILKEAEGNVYTTDMMEDTENPDKVIYSEDAENILVGLGVVIVEPPEEEEEPAAAAPAPAPAAPARAPRGAAAAPAPAPARAPRGAAAPAPAAAAPAPAAAAPAPAAAAPAPAAAPARGARGAAAPAPAPAPAAAPARGARGAAAPAPAPAAAKPAAPAPKPAKAPKAAAVPKNPAFTRSTALAESIKAGGTKEQIVADSDAIYVEEGGVSNLTVAEAMFRYGVPLLKELGFIEVDANGVFALAVAAA